MREIKFRAWFKGKKYKVVAIDWQDDIIISAHLKDVSGEIIKVYPENDYGDKVILEQYTGLKDINGIEIYKGDIVRITSSNWWRSHKDRKVIHEKAIVSFAEKTHEIAFKPINKKYNIYYHDFFRSGDEKHYFEVIGNIHEEKEKKSRMITYYKGGKK